MVNFPTFLLTILMLIGMVFIIISEMFHEWISLNLVFLLLLVNFVSGFRLELMHIALIGNIRSSPIHLHSFQLLCCCLVHRNHLFRLCQREKPSDSKVKFRQASNHCKRFLKLPNLHLLIKQKSPLLPRSLALVTSGELLIVFSTKVDLLYLLYSTVGRFCLLHLIKQNCMLKIFL